MCVRHCVVCQGMYVSVSQVASFRWTKGGPVDGRGGAIANGEATAATTASGTASPNIDVVRGQLILIYYFHHKCMNHFALQSPILSLLRFFDVSIAYLLFCRSRILVLDFEYAT